MHFMTFRCLRFLKLWKSRFCLLVALAGILFMLHVKMKTLLFKWIIIWVLSSWDPASMSSCAGLFDFIHTAQDVRVRCVLELPRNKCIFATDGTSSSGDSSWTQVWNCNSCFVSLNASKAVDCMWLEIPGQKGRGCYAHQMCRKIWDNLYGVLKTCGLTVFGCISTIM